MKKIIAAFTSAAMLLTGCSSGTKTAYTQITQDDAKRMMDEQDVIILDVREDYEYDAGHIKGAVLLPVGSISEETAASVIPDKDSTVLVYCRSGNRSKKAMDILYKNGYNVIELATGANGWVDAGKELVKK